MTLLEAVKHGKRMRRPHWKLNFRNEYSWIKHSIFSDHFQFGSGHKWTPWHKDLVADDWIVEGVNDSPPGRLADWIEDKIDDKLSRIPQYYCGKDYVFYCSDTNKIMTARCIGEL